MEQAIIRFQKLTLDDWRQFDHLEVEFDPRLTILTGANGAGKTTILHILSRYFGWNLNLVGTKRTWGSRLRRRIRELWSPKELARRSSPANQRCIGELAFSDGKLSTLHVPEGDAAAFQIYFSFSQVLPGLFISSHRPEYFYTPIKSIPTDLSPGQQLLDQYINLLRQRYVLSAKVEPPLVILKKALISLAVFGYASNAVVPKEGARETFEGFEELLRKVLPKPLGFKRLVVSSPDVILDTSTGPFSMDAVSGGVASIIDMTWQIYMRSRLSSAFTVVMDEPETHLHPALQRELLPSLLDAFPGAQFIVASHNPFIISSSRDARVYALGYNQEGMVETRLLDLHGKASDAAQVLRNVLGIPSTSPVWVEREIATIVQGLSDSGLTTEALSAAKARLERLGLEVFLPDTISKVIPGANQ